MNKKLLLLIVMLGAPQLVLAHIPTDFANGIEPLPATEGAKSEGVLPEEAVVQLIAEGVEPPEAVAIVRIVYGLTEDCGLTQEIAIAQMTEVGVPLDTAVTAVNNRCGDGDCELSVAPVDSVITAALNALPECEETDLANGEQECVDTLPLVALFTDCSIGALAGQTDQPPAALDPGNGGGLSVSPN